MNLRSFPVDRQFDMKDCGPACLKSISKYYGKYYSLQLLRDKCGITREGVSVLDLSYAAEYIGLRSLSVKSTFSDLMLKIPMPCIIHWRKSHFVVVYRISKKYVYVSDPAKGLITYSHSEFIKGWCNLEQNLGHVLVLEPQADFKQREASEKLERRKTFQNVLAYFTPYKKSFLNLFVVMLVVTALQAVMPFISKSVIDVGIHTSDINFINIVLIGNVIIILGITLCNAVRDWILQHATSRINIALISDYLIKLMKLPINFFETKTTGDILQRANDHERIRSFIMNNTLNIVFSSLTFLVFGIILFSFNILVFATYFGFGVLYVGWIMFFLKFREKLDWEYFELIASNQSYWVETIEGIQDIKINNYEKTKRWKWENIQARLHKVNLRMLSINNFQGSGAYLINSLQMMIITFICAKGVIRGEITFGVMISTQFITGILNGPLTQLIQFMVAGQGAKISFLRLNEIHQLEDEDEFMGTNSFQMPHSKEISINNLSFRYTNSSPVILKHIYLTIPEGKVTAIVGDSGSGKSTLLKLLLRLYSPTLGEINIGGMNINNITLKEWRTKCGAVLQDGKIFSDTILNNIILGEEEIDNQRLKHAVETANIASEIEKLPQGYQTIMGERGRGLSGGQKQRVLIARALYKNPEFLFFDEATNSLDTINEQKIVSALENVFKGKTVVIIAHRLSTIRKADQIIVMKDGQITETGNHDSLVKAKGHYYELVKAQVDLVETVKVSTLT